jgi:ceramide glucosyltransferase
VQAEFLPGLTLLKPLKGCDEATEDCLRSWFEQEYQGPVQILFAAASADDPVCQIIQKLVREFPASDAKLVVCGPLIGTNLKISKLVQLEKLARHELVVISDADVRVPRDFLANAVTPLQQPEVGLVNCFYSLATPSTLAMQWEAVAVNADFWSQVLQSQTLKPLDFALGAVMLTRRSLLQDIGGFAALTECLADDYQLGHRIAERGYRIVLSPVVVECRSEAQNWGRVWKHQLRWARTIRVCQPVPYFFSILSNPTLWPLLWVLIRPSIPAVSFFALCLIARTAIALDLKRRLTREPANILSAWLVPLKDLFQTAIWALAFLGTSVEWRGEKMRLLRDGTLVRTSSSAAP